MSEIKTLKELARLKQTRYGRPAPRHGLKLLYWFATECVYLDDGELIMSRCFPNFEDFGFHPFDNRYNQNYVRLLPVVDYPYYIVGNLNLDGSYSLPDYVTKDNTCRKDNSNMDRIIVSFDDEWFDAVYITAHDSVSDFDKNSTYHITKNLLMIISQMNLRDFLLEMGYSDSKDPDLYYYYSKGIRRPVKVTSTAPTVKPQPNQDYRIEIEPPSAQRQSQDSFWERYCTIL